MLKNFFIVKCTHSVEMNIIFYDNCECIPNRTSLKSIFFNNQKHFLTKNHVEKFKKFE